MEPLNCSITPSKPSTDIYIHSNKSITPKKSVTQFGSGNLRKCRSKSPTTTQQQKRVTINADNVKEIIVSNENVEPDRYLADNQHSNANNLILQDSNPKIPWIPPPARSSSGKQMRYDQFGRSLRSSTESINRLMDESANNNKDQVKITLSNSDTAGSVRTQNRLEKELQGSSNYDENIEDTTNFLLQKLVEAEVESEELQEHTKRFLNSLTGNGGILKDGRRISKKDLIQLTNSKHQFNSVINQAIRVYDDLRDLLRQQYDIEVSRDDLKRQNIELSGQVNAFEEEIVELQKDLNHCNNVMFEQQTANRILKDHVDTLKSANENQEQYLENLRSKLRKSDNVENSLEQQIQSLQGELEKEQQDNSRMLQLLQDSNKKSERNHEILTQATEQDQRHCIQIQELKATLSEKDLQVKQLTEKLNQEYNLSQFQKRELTQLRDSNIVDLEGNNLGSLSRESSNLNKQSIKDISNEEIEALRRTNRQLCKSLDSYEKLVAQLQVECQTHKLNYTQCEELADDQQEHIKLLEEKVETLQITNDKLTQELHQIYSETNKNSHKSESAKMTIVKLKDQIDVLTLENNKIVRRLEDTMTSTQKQISDIKLQGVSLERQLQGRILDLEAQLAHSKSDIASLNRIKEETEQRLKSRYNEIKERLDMSNSTNKSLNIYIQGLRKTYSNNYYNSINIGEDSSPENLHNSTL